VLPREAPGTGNFDACSKRQSGMKRVCVLAIVVLLALPACGEASGSIAAGDESEATERTASAPPAETGIAVASVGQQIARVELRIEPDAVETGGAPRAVLLNTGEVRVGYAPPFILERKTIKGWRPVNRRQAFRIPLRILEPGSTSDPQPIAVYFDEPTPVQLRPGLYRVTKSISLAPGQPRPPYMKVRATFSVLPGRGQVATPFGKGEDK
jgi:hypothetical protein